MRCLIFDIFDLHQPLFLPLVEATRGLRKVGVMLRRFWGIKGRVYVEEWGCSLNESKSKGALSFSMRSGGID